MTGCQHNGVMAGQRGVTGQMRVTGQRGVTGQRRVTGQSGVTGHLVSSRLMKDFGRRNLSSCLNQRVVMACSLSSWGEQGACHTHSHSVGVIYLCETWWRLDHHPTVGSLYILYNCQLMRPPLINLLPRFDTNW